LKTTHS